ncbi:hypothetical protein ACWGJQ_22300 [Peribacillus simplex]
MFQKWIGSQLKKPKGPLSKLNSNGNDTILEVGIGNGSTLSRLAQVNILGKN